MRVSAQSGQTSTEYMLVIGVVVIAVVAGAYTFVPVFNNGVRALAEDVERILGGDGINGQGGRNGGDSGTLTDPNRGPSISMDGLDQVADNGNNPFQYIIQDLGKETYKNLGPVIDIFGGGTQVAALDVAPPATGPPRTPV